MLLEYALQTILILPSAVALLLATCLLSLQLFVVPLHFLPDAVVTRLRRSPACYASDSSLVKAYDFVIVGGTLASHVWFMRLRKQHPKATILLLEPPLLDYRSLIFTFFAGLDIGVRHDVPYFRAYPFYRVSSSTELTANQKAPYVRSVINTFEVLINELARDLAAHDDPAIKLPCYRIVQRVDPASIEKEGALSCRHVFPIQYSGLRNAQNLKVLLGVESITWLGYTRDRRLAVQVDIQNQEQPFVFYVNRDLHLFDTVNAAGSSEPSIQEHQFENLTDHQENDDEDDDEDGKVGNSLHQRFYAFRRISVDEDSCALWTFDLAEEFDGDPSSDPATAIEILVGFGGSTSHSAEKEEFFETATSFKVLQLTQVSDGWVGLEIQQTVYNDSKHHLMHWGYEMIQRVFDGLNADGIVDIHSDTASVNTIPQSPGLSPTADQEPLTPTIKRHSEMFPHARVHRPTVDHLIVKDDHDGQQRLPSYLARIWSLVFVDNNHHVAELLADPDAAEKHHPFSAKLARLLQSRACFRSAEDPAILRSTVVQSRELNQQTPEEEDEEEDEDDGRRSSYGSLSDLEGNYYSADPYSVAQQEEDDEDEDEDDDDDDDAVSTSDEYQHDQTSSSDSSTSEGSVISEGSYDHSGEVSYANSGDEDEEDEQEENQDDEDEEEDEEEQLVDHVEEEGEEEYEYEDEANPKDNEEFTHEPIEEEPEYEPEYEPEQVPEEEEEAEYYEDPEQEEQEQAVTEEQEQDAMAEEYVEQLQEEEEQHDEGEAHPVEPGEDDRHEDVAPVIEAPAVNNQDTEDELPVAVEDLAPSEPAVEEQTREAEVKVREAEYFSDAVAASTAEERPAVEEEKTQAGGKKKKKAKKQKRRV